MYAIIQSGGKQYKVQPGDLVRVEKLQQNLGTEFDLQDVLLVGGQETHVGKPFVANAKVTVVVTKQALDAKVIIFKKKRRQGYRRLRGHRQSFTELFVKAITAPNGEVSSTDIQAPVVDVKAVAEEKAQKRIAARLEKKQAGIGSKKEKVAKKKPVEVKKKAKAASKKTKKKVAKKTTTKKKTAKKATKKTAKKK